MAKKEKAPEKPFPQQMEEDIIPTTKAAFEKRNITDLKLGYSDKLLTGSFDGGRHEFKVIFAEEDLTAPKYFRFAVDGVDSSTIESFMIDERKITADLFAFYLTQRLYAQQWY